MPRTGHSTTDGRRRTGGWSFGRRVQSLRAIWPLVALATINSCSPSSERSAVSAEEREIAGDHNDVKVAVDAPWRLEPHTQNGQLKYGQLPLQFTIHDSDKAEDDFAGDSIRHVIKVQVYEKRGGGDFEQTGTYYVGAFHEIQKSSVWKYVKERFDYRGCGPDAPADLVGCGQVPDLRVMCRLWNGNRGGHCEPERLAYVQDIDEWHGTLMHQLALPHQPGDDVEIKVAFVVREHNQRGLDTDVHVETHLRVHLGEAPLPKFDSGWAYGDLHYHSELTNNAGEQAYSFRGTLQAMASLGLDFLFATDHSSNNRRIFDPLDSYPDHLSFNGLGDASPTKWAWGHYELNHPGGANSQVLSRRTLRGDGTLAAPQIFLGSEVDVIPEVERPTEQIGFRNIMYDADLACSRSYSECFTPTADGRYLVKDRQGANDIAYARQHLVHLPDSSARDDAGVFGDTSTYGGATRRLQDLLRYDYEEQQKGYAFLAHPFSGPSDGLAEDVGPTLIPYTELQYREAMRSPYILGLQLWNEDDRFKTGIDLCSIPILSCDPLEDIEPNWDASVNVTEAFSSRMRRYTSAWDALQLIGMDPSFTETIDWLSEDEPRRLFMAGGSDAHGDFNFRRHGRIAGLDGVSDTAIGKPRNLVNTGAPTKLVRAPLASATTYAYSQESVSEGLRSGNMTVTDGPALRIVYDVNENGVIDEDDVPMGAFTKHDRGKPAVFLIEWISTPEWGDVESLELYLGLYSEDNLSSALYRPILDGDPTVSWYDVFSGLSLRREMDAGGVTLINPAVPLSFTGTALTSGSSSGKRGVLRFVLDSDAFPVPASYDEGRRQLLGSRRADRFFVRAVARTERKNQTHRWAYTNPVWVKLRLGVAEIVNIISGYMY